MYSVFLYLFFSVVSNTDKIYNNDSGMIYSAAVVEIDPVLKNNTWEQIASASESGNIPSTWKVGDEIDITLSGTFNETVTLQIWDFKHFDKSDGSGKAGIVFGMKNLMKDYQKMNSSNTNSGGWNNTTMKKTVMANILKSMPSNLRSYIKEVNTYANQGGSSSSSSKGLLSKDKVFLPGFTEVFGPSVWSSQSNTETNQKQFPIFTDNNSRIKKMNNGAGSAEYWWTRSPSYNVGNFFVYVDSDGYNGNYNPYSRHGVCFCFNV